VYVDLQLAADPPQMFAGIQAVIEWEPEYLQLTGATTSDYEWWAGSGFLDDGQGINDTWADGDALWVGFGVPWNNPVAPLTACTLEFTALTPTLSTEIGLSDYWTKVASVGGQNITGDVSGVSIGIGARRRHVPTWPSGASTCPEPASSALLAFAWLLRRRA